VSGAAAHRPKRQPLPSTAPDIMVRFGEMVRQARQTARNGKKLSQAQAAAKAGIGANSLHLLEVGRGSAIALDSAVSLAVTLGIDLNALKRDHTGRVLCDGVVERCRTACRGDD
jgi:ribosome-binding protein aMBF1 (putative translation factor)